MAGHATQKPLLTEFPSVRSGIYRSDSQNVPSFVTETADPVAESVYIHLTRTITPENEKINKGNVFEKTDELLTVKPFHLAVRKCLALRREWNQFVGQFSFVLSVAP
jgi:hypothetical protein